MSTKQNHPSLCFRCEHRARFHERGWRPRMECGSEGSVCSCYMYKPVLPVWTAPSDQSDARPRFSMPLISSRESALRVAEDGVDGRYRAVAWGDAVLVYFAVYRKASDHWRVFCNCVAWPVARFPRRLWWRLYYRTIGRVVEWWQERREEEA